MKDQYFLFSVASIGSDIVIGVYPCDSLADCTFSNAACINDVCVCKAGYQAIKGRCSEYYIF